MLDLVMCASEMSKNHALVVHLWSPLIIIQSLGTYCCYKAFGVASSLFYEAPCGKFISADIQALLYCFTSYDDVNCIIIKTLHNWKCDVYCCPYVKFKALNQKLSL